MRKANILSDEEMRKLGFTDEYNKDYWFFYARLKCRGNITFNFSITKRTGYYSIDILNEMDLKPFPYKKYRMLKNQVNMYINHFLDKGVLSVRPGNEMGSKKFNIRDLRKRSSEDEE